MRATTTESTPQVAHGVLQRLDVIDRKMTVRQESGVVTYAISSHCEVLLNGERVKLRMLQPRDHVRVAYRGRSEPPAALSVEAVTRTSQPLALDPIG
jgi:hypothetical protein